MIVLAETTETATTSSVRGENGVWKKPKNIGNNKDTKLDMMGNNEKRNHMRWYYKGPIWLSSFNKNNLMGAQTSNFCLGGMCFKSSTYFKGQSVLLLRINSEGWDFACARDLEGLRTITLGEVKWCKKISNKTSGVYETGIKYLAPVY